MSFLKYYAQYNSISANNNTRYYIIIRRERNKSKNIGLHSNETSPPVSMSSLSMSLKHYHIYDNKNGMTYHTQNSILINGPKFANPRPSIDEIYHMKVNFAKSMYRVVIHDNGLNVIYTPAKLITLAIPSIRYSVALKIIDYACKNKSAIVAYSSFR
jgi:hypothetical protein